MAKPAAMGLTVPLDGVPLGDHPAILREAEEAGYTDAWSLEVDGVDGFTPLAVAAQATARMRLGTAIANVYTRGPGTLAISAAGVAELAPGRFVLGLGTGSDVIVERWNSGRFARPLQRMRDMVTVLRAALAGERVSLDLPTLRVAGLRLSRPPQSEIPIYVAALRERMLSLAGELADGVILNWLAASDVPRCVAVAREAARRAGRDPEALRVVARLFVYVDPPDDELEIAMRRHITGYLTVPVYRAFHEWLGRGEVLAPMQQAWTAGDRRAAVAAVPEQVMRDLLIAGTPEERRAQVAAYVEAGVDVPVVHLISRERDPDRRREVFRAAIRELAPRG
ncbi:MAG TPA: LLM class F420-dependent oxidoreductase [Dehalococcoidia bacterium]